MTTTIDEPMLDGMPEPPPAWVRPEQGVRMSALGLVHQIAAALAHVGTDDELPILTTINLEVVDGQLITRATDRYTVIRERRLVSQTCDDFRFLLRAEDAKNLGVLLRSVLRGIEKDSRDVEPCDIALEATDDGPTLRVLGQDLDVRFTEHEDLGQFPSVDVILERAVTALDAGDLAQFDAYINPTLLNRVGALQQAGRGSSLFLFQKPRALDLVVVTTLDEDDDVIVAVVPIKAGAGGES